MCKLIIGFFPSLNNLFVTFFFCNKSALIVLCNQIHSILSLFDQCRLLRRYGHIGNGYGHSSSCGVFITHCFDVIQNLSGCGSTMNVDNFLKDLFQSFFTYMEINFQNQIILRNASVHKTKILWKNLIKNETSQCGLNRSGLFCSICHFLCYTYMDSGV